MTVYLRRTLLILALAAGLLVALTTCGQPGPGPEPLRVPRDGATATPTVTPNYWWDSREGTPPGKSRFWGDITPGVTPTAYAMWPTVVAITTTVADGSQAYNVSGANCNGAGCWKGGGLGRELTSAAMTGVYETHLYVTAWSDYAGLYPGFTPIFALGTWDGFAAPIWGYAQGAMTPYIWNVFLNDGTTAPGDGRAYFKTHGYLKSGGAATQTDIGAVALNTWYTVTVGWQLTNTASANHAFTVTWNGATTNIAVACCATGRINHGVTAVIEGVFDEGTGGTAAKVLLDNAYLVEGLSTTPTPYIPPTATPTATSTATPTPTNTATPTNTPRATLPFATITPRVTPITVTPVVAPPGSVLIGGCWAPLDGGSCGPPPAHSDSNSVARSPQTYDETGVTLVDAGGYWVFPALIYSVCTTGAYGGVGAGAYAQGYSQGTGAGGAVYGVAGVGAGGLNFNPSVVRTGGGGEYPPLSSLNKNWSRQEFSVSGLLPGGLLRVWSSGGVAYCWPSGGGCRTQLSLDVDLICPGIALTYTPTPGPGTPAATATPTGTPTATGTPPTATPIATPALTVVVTPATTPVGTCVPNATHLDRGNPTSNYSAVTQLTSNRGATPQAVGVLAFACLAKPPAVGATQAATLTLYLAHLWQDWPGQAHASDVPTWTLDLDALAVPWTASRATWRSSGVHDWWGAGAASVNDTERLITTTTTSLAGFKPEIGGPITIDVTDSVRAWLDDGYANYGWRLRLRQVSCPTANCDLELGLSQARARLEVTYAPP